MISHLDNKIISLRKRYPTHNFLNKVKSFYDNVVSTWMENFPLNNKEIGGHEDEAIKNKILDMINTLNKLDK